MGNTGCVNSISMVAVEAPAFGEEPGKSSRVAFGKGVFGGPLKLYFSWRGSSVDTLAGKIEGFSLLQKMHGSSEIGELVKSARKPDGNHTGGVEGEEPDTRFPFERDIGADVEFMKGT